MEDILSNYKRIYLPGHSYFFTVVTANRDNLFSEDKNVQLFKAALRYVILRKPFKIEAICILPDHLHCIWSMQDDCDHSVRWQMIKTYFTRQYRYNNPEFKNNKIWQPRYWDHMIRDQDDLHRHVDYIHYNPVKHGLVGSVKDWRYSTFRKFYALGHYDANWGDGEPESVVDLHYE